MNELAVAFVMNCDTEGLTYEQGIARAEQLADEIVMAAEGRADYLTEAEAA